MDLLRSVYNNSPRQFESDFDNLALWEGYGTPTMDPVDTKKKTSRKTKGGSSSSSPIITPPDRTPRVQFNPKDLSTKEYPWQTFDKFGSGSTTAPLILPTWVMAEKSVRMCESLYQFFFMEPSVSIQNTTFEKISNFQVLIFMGNCYGLREPTANWDRLENFFGKPLVAKIREVILVTYRGEAPPYTSLTFTTEHPMCKHLIYTTIDPTTNVAYHRYWSALLALMRIDDQGHTITRFVSEGNPPRPGTEDDVSEKMYLAYLNAKSPPLDASIGHMDAEERLLRRREFISIEGKKGYLLHMLWIGDLAKRGFISPMTLDFLLGIFVGKENLDFVKEIQDRNHLRKLAAKTIARYTYPDEAFDGVKEMIVNQNALHLILEMVVNGELIAHREISPEEITKEKLLARGTSAKVYRGKWNQNEVAIKVFNLQEEHTESEELFRREVAIMSTLKHRNLIPFYGACTTAESSRFIVMKLLSRGTLHHLITDVNVALPLITIVEYALDVAMGMVYLHSKDFIHRDLKSPNLLLDENNVVLISDFGTSRMLKKTSNMTSGIGTLGWTAPEIFNDERYSEKADVYSFGIGSPFNLNFNLNFKLEFSI
eukprot:TRINITY_DN575_c0_g2_i3.p1 TRINITY_DN575_c0_g2~~TRINITY_DN575_c0_g2_i3.p1  ORF type:complete len:598 (+),score=176.46 TRINITY_DN575_c0_g2_i3:290-2083(+)